MKKNIGLVFFIFLFYASANAQLTHFDCSEGRMQMGEELKGKGLI